MKSNEKNNENPKNEEALVCTNSDSLGSGASTIVDQQQHQQQQQPLKKFSLKGNQLSGSILIGNYNVRREKGEGEKINLKGICWNTKEDPFGVKRYGY